MSKHSSDSFLPSGAIPSPPLSEVPSTISQIQLPRRGPYSISPTGLTPPISNIYLRPSRSLQHQTPLSPPKSRSTSAEDTSASLVEDWRAYTGKLRSQIEGERAHMLADRARMEEVIAEERALWDNERAILKARIAELEAELEKMVAGTPSLSPPLSQRERPGGHALQGTQNITGPDSNHTRSLDNESARSAVPQESGRNADGSPFYAPAPRNPSRTFELSEINPLRVDTIFEARESPIRVTSKELTPLDFRVQSPPATKSELKTITETPIESIDISRIQPDLEGVSIRTSALSPKFTAKILSPQGYSPSKRSPSLNPFDQEAKENLDPQPRDNSRSPTGRVKPDIQGMMLQPETRRLTLHAGHTPNHSISKLTDLLEESGGATPTQASTGYHPLHHPSTVDGDSTEEESGDVELSGPLGLINEAVKDDAFITQLVEKLDEVKKSEEFSLSSETMEIAENSENTKETVEKGNVDVDDDMPPLRLKPSLNFGRPIGRM